MITKAASPHSPPNYTLNPVNPQKPVGTKSHGHRLCDAMGGLAVVLDILPSSEWGSSL